ncbi:hypothetical protein [Halalkalibacter krulwichiae]|uniref:DUF5067 domain-containing protein n=1 Tax=Halalkalibacter krulwichiae TaxID=199441 RepID=A0A1X9MDR0_9BACI|nr:hypothetical protein [Halalkalibacter krulwichiae]ARK30764.1 hypothetical protein BkAM31D_13485 [Halalkalibacter krulwichiae]
MEYKNKGAILVKRKMFLKLHTLLLALLMIAGCSNTSDKRVSELSSYEYENVSANEVDLFSQLEFKNVTVSKNSINGWYEMTGEITNKHSKKIMGYAQVALYDNSGGIVDSTLIPIPGSGGLNPNEKGIFKKSITQLDFANYEFFDSTLVEN